MKTLFILFLLFVLTVNIYAQEFKSPVGFYIKPGINFLSKNTYTQNTNQVAEFEWGGGVTIFLNKKKDFLLAAEYTTFKSKGRLKSDNSKDELNFNSFRVGFINTLPVDEKINLRFSFGLSFNKSNKFSSNPIGYFSAFGFEKEFSSSGFYFFSDLQYDLINFENDDFNGNLGGTKIFLGIKLVAKSDK